MKNTTTPCISLQGSSARNRRYNSIAVGFPIRNDQKAHSQRVSKGFPSWVGARCAYTYVQGRENCVLSNAERLNKSITGAYIRLAFDAFTPNERPQKCPRKPTLRPTKHNPSTHDVPHNDSPPAHDAPPNSPHSTHEAILVRLRFTYGSLGSHLTQLNTHPAPVHHTFRVKSQTYPGSFTIH